jgi:methyltransferase
LALLGLKLGIAIPDTVLEDKESLRDKTAKLGLVARACAVYGVDSVEVFEDKKGRGEMELIAKVLRFLETPQYLRKRLFPIDETLRYSGMLPPLRIPSHKSKVALEKLRVGDLREGIANGDGSVDVGLDRMAAIEGDYRRGTRVTTMVTSASPLAVKAVRREDLKVYWGYAVESRAAEAVFRDQSFPVKVATSRMGRPLSEGLPALRKAVGSRAGVKLVFGSPARGLYDIFDGLDDKADLVLNLFVDQKVETVRTEEAIAAGLGLVNALVADKA